MRHAAPHDNSLSLRLSRAGELVFAGVVYATTGVAVGLVTLGASLAMWGLWQWLGVS